MDRAPGHLPFAGRLGADANVLYATGFSGNGVAPSALFGRPPALLPPEPLRSVGGELVRAALGRLEQAEESGRTAPRTRHALGRLVTAHTPPGLDPRLSGLRRAAGRAD